MPAWLRMCLIVSTQILVIWVIFLLGGVGFTLAGLDPYHRPLSQQMHELFWPGLGLAVAIRIFKYKRLVRIFKSDA